MESLSGESVASPFWQFSLAFYRQSGVADACIRLQEEAGVDVNLLLFLLWQATLKRAVSTGEVQALERRVAPWREEIVIPLRTVRRALKSPPALVPAATAELFRTRIKAVELEAERLQEQAMYELHALRRWGVRYRRKKKPRGSMLQAMPRSRGRAFKLLPSKHCSRRSIYDHLSVLLGVPTPRVIARFSGRPSIPSAPADELARSSSHRH